MTTLLVRGGTLVTAQGQSRADVLCRDERIVALGPELAAPEAAVLDAAGCYVLPGGVDAHVHLQLPVGALTSTDDFYTGTVAAACGGTTTIVDFATPERGRALRRAVARRRAEADGVVAVDYGLHLVGTTATARTVRALAGLAAQGYRSIKLYTVYPGLYLEDGPLLRLLAAARAAGLLPLVHCENRAIVAARTAHLLAAGQTGPRFHPLARPAVAESEAVARVLALAEIAGTPVVIAHLSCHRALEAVRQARARGQEVYVETCPHYLLLTEQAYGQAGFAGARYVLAPPLRSPADVAALWPALAQGEIDFVATDHCPWNYRGMKERGRDDFSRIPNGLPGIETRLPLLWSAGVGQGRLTPERFVAVTATAPAQRYGLYPRKGALVPGADADLVVWDPAREVTLRAATLHQRVDYTPYEGWVVRGYPRDVVLRGRVIVRAGEFVGARGQGRFVGAAAAR